MKMGEYGQPIRLGVIGLGGRGMGQLRTLLDMPDVIVPVVCDRYADRLEAGQALVSQVRGTMPDGTTEDVEVTSRTDLDAVMVFSSWETHIRIAVDAVEHGIRPCLEVGGANSVDACWQLVRTSERCGVPVMLLENCCYGRDEMTLLNMIRQGLFGTLVSCQGGYRHDLRDEIGWGDVRRHYRLRHFLNRNGELYPTHELGPIAKYLNINRGNRMTSLVSVASKAAGLPQWFSEHRPDSEWAGHPVHQGDIVHTIITCANGETILLTHDCTLPRPYSRGGCVQGTRGIWMEDNRSIYLEAPGESRPEPHLWEKDERYWAEFQHPLWRDYDAFGPRGGHDGMDYLALRSFIESVQKREIPPIDVYDTASWMSITALSEMSIASGQAVAIPDFTNGRWLEKRPAATGLYALD